MKKTVIHAALIALTLPMSLNAIGLGEMTVKSSLDQPFLAEIELIDVGSAPLVGIKVGVADPENFHQIGLERVAALSLLNFNIEKNAKGKLVIKIRSMERITEPYMELVVDLTWPNGQLYKAYTVLLDPPGYQLVSTRAQSSPTYYKNYKKATQHHVESGVINKKVITEVQHNPVTLKDNKNKTTYGPTITNENVWQIAQRYKTSEIILPQVVLAIVGANPDAFKEGNLNGLKIGIRLVIPATREIMQVPAELATEEVMAHDKAWNEKSPINHVLSPPYMNGQTINPVPQINTNFPIKNSEVPAIPKFTTIQAMTPAPVLLPKFISPNQVVPIGSTNQQPVQNAHNPEHDSSIKAEISITTAAVESVRESNALLMEQLHLLQEQNKKLQTQLDKRDKEMESIRAQMQLMMKQRLAVASQANSSLTNNPSSNLWPLWLLLVVAAGGGGFAYWYFKYREQEIHDEPYLSSSPVEPKPFISEAERTPKKVDETTIPSDVAAPVLETGVVDKTEPTIPSSPTEESENTSVDRFKKIKKDDDFAAKEIMIKKEGSKSVKKQVSKKTKDTSLKNEPIAAPDSPLEKNEMTSKSNAVTTAVKEKSGKEKKEKDKIEDDKTGKEEGAKEEAVIEFESPIEQEPSHDLIKNHSSSEEVIASPDSKSISEHSDENEAKEESSSHDVLEFESGLHQLIPEKSEKKAKPKEEQDNDDRSIDFVPTSSPSQSLIQKNSLEQTNKPEKNKRDRAAIKEEGSVLKVGDEDSNLKSEPKIENQNIEIDQEITEFFVESEEEKISEDNDITNESQSETIVTKPEDSQTATPLKSKGALDTLLALAKTYIGMDDIESARTSLEEVLEYGSDIQKAEAQRLLNEIKDK